MAWTTRWPTLRRPPAQLVDAALALALTLAVAVAISVGYEQGRPPDAAAYALAPTLGVLALGRRRSAGLAGPGGRARRHPRRAAQRGHLGRGPAGGAAAAGRGGARPAGPG